jgi:integrase
MARPASGQIVERSDARGTTFALRFRAYGQRRYVTLGSSKEGWNRARADTELQNTLADVRRGIWRAPQPEPIHPEPPPTFHVFASRWVEQRELEGLKPRSIEALKWALSGHLLGFFGSFLVSEITVERVGAYRESKLAEREQKLVPRPLSNRSINATLQVLGQVLDAAIDDGHLDTNPARGPRRRLKGGKPKRTWLEPHEAQAVLDAAGKHRALLATMILGGLRVGELTGLRWRHVDLAGSKLRVAESKTDAGLRVVDLSPMALDELKLHRANSAYPEPEDLVFCTSRGTPLNRNNIRTRVLGKAVAKASDALEKTGMPRIQDGVTNHSLRRTFASLLYEAGASPAYVMSQMGHTSSALALEVYAKKMQRERDTGRRMDALIRGADWAQTGTNGDSPSVSLPEVSTEAVAIPLQ